MKTEAERNRENCLYNNGAMAMNDVLTNGIIRKTVIAVEHGGEEVLITISAKGAMTLQLVAYTQPDKHGNTETDAWAEICYSGNPEMPVARMYTNATFYSDGRIRTDGGFGEWIPTSDEKVLEWVAAVAVEARGAKR